MLKSSAISGRTPEGRFIRAVEAQLSEHVGGSPSIVQRMLIRRLANVSLRLELLDRKFAKAKPTDFDTKMYGALHNSFRLLCREIGLKGAEPPVPTIAEYATEKYGTADS